MLANLNELAEAKKALHLCLWWMARTVEAYDASTNKFNNDDDEHVITITQELENAVVELDNCLTLYGNPLKAAVAMAHRGTYRE